MSRMGLPGGSEGKTICLPLRRPRFDPESGRSLEEGDVYPLQYSCLEDPRDRGARWATVHGVTKSRTQLSA